MARELTLTMSLAYADSEGTEEQAAPDPIEVNVATKNIIHNKQTIGITEEAIALGDVTVPGFIFIVNRDETNYVKILSGTGATEIARLLPGEYGCWPLPPGMTAPFAIANTAPVKIEYWLAGR